MKRPLALAAMMVGCFVSLPALAYADGEELPAPGGATPLPPLPTSAPIEPVPPSGMIVEPARQPAMPPAPPRFPQRVELQLGGGATYRSIFGLPMTMGSVDLGLGAHVAEMVAFHLTVDGDFGKTTHGLTSRAYSISPTIELVEERFRIGLGPELMWFGIWRATTSSVIARGALGARVIASFDVLKTAPATLFIGARGQVDWLFPAGPWSATGGAGLRF